MTSVTSVVLEVCVVFKKVLDIQMFIVYTIYNKVRNEGEIH